MIIKISNVRDSLTDGNRSDLTIEQSELITGDIEIHFQGVNNEEPELYKRSAVNIPLMISETNLFIDRVKLRRHDTWNIYFTPFVDGYLEGSEIVLTRGAKDGGIKVLEKLLPDQTKAIKETLARFAGKYGCVKPSPGALR